jgi:transcriptional regulator with XRE-family HTH domain
MSEQVAKNLKRFREMLGWTQEHLAEAAGLSSRTIQRAERDGELGAETMQALAAVFDVAVADLQRVWPTDAEIREALEEAAKRYKLIPLTRVDRASDLRPFMGAHAWQVDHVSGLSEEQEDEIAVLAELLRDYGDMWSDIGPTGQRDALKTIYESIDRLQAGGLCVGVGLDAMRLVSPGSPDPWTMDVLRVLVSEAAEPRMAVLREKNCPVRFAW